MFFNQQIIISIYETSRSVQHSCCTYFLPQAYFQRDCPRDSGTTGSHLPVSMEFGSVSPVPIFPVYSSTSSVLACSSFQSNSARKSRQERFLLINTLGIWAQVK